MKTCRNCAATAFILIVIFLSCTKAPDTSTARMDSIPRVDSTPKNLPPFTVTVTDRSGSNAIINWTVPTNNYDTNTVYYRVALNGKTIHADLKRTVDTLRQLSADSVYSGMVYAYTTSGHISSAPFTLDKVSGFWIYGDVFGSLTCYDVFSLKRVWYTPDYQVSGTPVIVNNVIYMSSYSNGTSAYDLKTGNRIWINDLRAYRTSQISGYAPLYKDGKLYPLIQDTAYKLFCLNSSDGSINWNYTYNRKYIFYTEPVVGNSKFFMASFKQGIFVDTGYLTAVDINTHQQVWEKDLGGIKICRNPVVYQNLLIYGGWDSKIYAVDQNTGATVWVRDFSVWYNNFGADAFSPLLYQNKVLVYSGNSGLYMLDATTGATVWRFAWGDIQPSSPCIGNGMVYFRSGNYIMAVDITKGTLVWKTDMGNAYTDEIPLVVRNKLYIPCEAFGRITWMNALDGTWHLYNSVYPSPRTDYVMWMNDTTYYRSTSGMIQ